MDAILKNLEKVWNPVAEVRRRQADGTLVFRAVAVPFLLVIIACSLAHAASFRFVADAFEHELARQGFETAGLSLLKNPLLANKFALETYTVLSLAIPLTAVSLLPGRVFTPVTRSAALAVIIIVSAAGTFYLAAIGAAFNFAVGVQASADVFAAQDLFNLLFPLQILVTVLILLLFWIRTFRYILKISWQSLSCILVVYWVSGGIFNNIFMKLIFVE